jgi:hypothetical protein
MPSQKKQLNIRISEEGEARLKRLVESMKAALGIDVSQADVIQAGLVELEKRYPGTPPNNKPASMKPPKRKKGEKT